MLEDIERMAGTVLGPGTLYGAIARLEQQGLIQPLQLKERRQPYRLTAEGARELRSRLDAMRRFAQAGLKKLEAR
jgi:DNA-binding PadR family transcriptional regulator